MVLPLLDSPFLSVTQYGECVTGPSRDKKKGKSQFHFLKVSSIQFLPYLGFLLLPLWWLCCALVPTPVLCLSPLCMPSGHHLLGQCHQESFSPGRWLATSCGSPCSAVLWLGAAPPASSLVGWEILGTLASQSGIEKREKTGWIWWWCSTLKSSSLSSGCKPRFHLLMVFCLDSQEQNKKTFSLLRFVIYGFGKAYAPLPIPLVWFAFSACLTVLLKDCNTNNSSLRWILLEEMLEDGTVTETAHQGWVKVITSCSANCGLKETWKQNLR